MSVAPIVPSYGWTDEEFDDLPADGRRRELIDGVLRVAPTPTGRHQLAAQRLGAALDITAPRDYVAIPGVEVKLSDSLRYIPDILALKADAYGDGGRWRYNADEVILAVEIVSDSSRAMDRILKPYQYATAGIPFYWRLEFEPTLTLHTYQRGLGAEYVETGQFTDKLEIPVPWPVSLDLARLVR